MYVKTFGHLPAWEYGKMLISLLVWKKEIIFQT